MSQQTSDKNLRQKNDETIAEGLDYAKVVARETRANRFDAPKTSLLADTAILLNLRLIDAQAAAAKAQLPSQVAPGFYGLASTIMEIIKQNTVAPDGTALIWKIEAELNRAAALLSPQVATPSARELKYEAALRHIAENGFAEKDWKYARDALETTVPTETVAALSHTRRIACEKCGNPTDGTKACALHGENCIFAASAIEPKLPLWVLDWTPEMMQAVENYYANWQRIQGIHDPDRMKADSWSAMHACRAAFKAMVPNGAATDGSHHAK